ncbi:hypothetical protein [Brevundimonas sp.]|uniref:hypothetical protein n=1 Tax=Brevundimonas sp. TaxID=1871086 RepID=UPI002D3F3550|nr:hypothetical protein [Brevundimonas sp.]HYC96805.1 hypothetical protein [Brevundimonas sp.]
MEAPTKRNAFLDWLFGAPLTGGDLARHLAERPPLWARNTTSFLYLLVLGLIAAGWMGLLDRLPLVGPWLARERTLILMGCLAIIIALDWYYKRRAGKGGKP